MLYDSIVIFHVSLKDCIDKGPLYLNRFYFSLDIINEFSNEDSMNLDEFILFLKNIKFNYRPV